MRNTDQAIKARRNEIMLECQRKGKVSVNELSERFNVSPLTIRRDLQFWEDSNAMIRNYGGAKLVQSFIPETNLNQDNEYAKHAIAKFAAGLVEDNDTIFINTSSTALLILKYIKNKHVNVVTNNGKAILMDYDPLISVQLTGGEIRNPKEALVGEFAINNLMQVTADKIFIGVSGISVKSGLTSALLPEVAINKMMIERCSGSIFVLADHTKIGLDHSFQSGSLKKVDYLITDTMANSDSVAALERASVKVIALEPLKALSLISE